MLLHLRSNRFYQLNSTGSRFWELLSVGRSPTQIRAQLLQEFEIDEARLAAYWQWLSPGERGRTFVREGRRRQFIAARALLPRLRQVQDYVWRRHLAARPIFARNANPCIASGGPARLGSLVASAPLSNQIRM